EQSPLGSSVNGDVQNRTRLQNAGNHAAHPAVILLQHQKVLRPDKRHGRRSVQSRGDLGNQKTRISGSGSGQSQRSQKKPPERKTQKQSFHEWAPDRRRL